MNLNMDTAPKLGDCLTRKRLYTIIAVNIQMIMMWEEFVLKPNTE
jgi:hypothetical protein